MKIKVDKKRCSGCHICEMVCSLFHLKVINTEKSAIRIWKDDLETSLNTPVLCHHCRDMKCLRGEDLAEELEKKNFTWNKDRAERCPFHALPVFGDTAYHCDLCGGDPQCIRACTPHALRIQQLRSEIDSS